MPARCLFRSATALRRLSATAFCLLFSFLSTSVPAAPIPITLSPELASDPQYVHTTSADGYDYIDYRGAMRDIDPVHAGRPQLPVLMARIILPDASQLDSLLVEGTVYESLSGSYLPAPVPDSNDSTDVPLPSPSYSGRFPERPIAVVNQGYWRGYHLATLAIYPLAYDGESHHLLLASHPILTALISSLPAEGQGLITRPLRSDPGDPWAAEDIARLRGSILNPEQFSEFYPHNAVAAANRAVSLPFGGCNPTEYPSTQSSPVSYLVITDEVDEGGNYRGAIVDVVREWLDGKIEKGLCSEVRTVSWIDTHVFNEGEGGDRAARIKHFIREAYANWGTRFVLLVGDPDIVPSRFLGGPSSHSGADLVRADIPCDAYYAFLDEGLEGPRQWNLDGDPYWWEDGSDHTSSLGYPDLYVARIPAQSAEDVQTILGKIDQYGLRAGGGYQPQVDAYYWSVLGAAGPTNSAEPYSGDNGIYQVERALNVLEAHPYDITRLLPTFPDDSFSCGQTLKSCFDGMLQFYQDEFGGDFDPWQGNDLYQKLNEGPHLVYHIEHSNRRALGEPSALAEGICQGDPDWESDCVDAFKGANQGITELTREEVNGLQNGERSSIVISGGSYTNEWDADGVGERFLRSPDGGAVAYIGRNGTKEWLDFDLPVNLFTELFDLLPTPPIGEAL